MSKAKAIVAAALMGSMLVWGLDGCNTWEVVAAGAVGAFLLLGGGLTALTGT